jgi:hypothetical protein
MIGWVRGCKKKGLAIVSKNVNLNNIFQHDIVCLPTFVRSVDVGRFTDYLPTYI